MKLIFGMEVGLKQVFFHTTSLDSCYIPSAPYMYIILHYKLVAWELSIFKIVRNRESELMDWLVRKCHSSDTMEDANFTLYFLYHQLLPGLSQ